MCKSPRTNISSCSGAFSNCLTSLESKTELVPSSLFGGGGIRARRRTPVFPLLRSLITRSSLYSSFPFQNQDLLKGRSTSLKSGLGYQIGFEFVDNPDSTNW